MKLRRYPNRNLWNLDRSRWATLRQVARAIAAGESIEVIDSKTGKDCTALVLTQLLYDVALKGEPLPAAPLLAVYREHLDKKERSRSTSRAQELADAIFEAERKKLR